MISVSGVSMRFGSKVLFEEVTTTFQRRPALRLDGPERRRQVDVHEAAHGRDRRRSGERSHGRASSACCARTSTPSTSIASSIRSSWATSGCGRRYKERDVLYAKADMTHEDGMRLGELEGHRRRGGRILGRERRRGAAAGPRHPRRAARTDDGGAAGRTEGSRAPRAGALRQSRSAAAGRADQPPRPRLDPLAAALPRALRGDAHRDLARSALPEQASARTSPTSTTRRSSRIPAATTTWCSPRRRSARPSRRRTRSARRRSRSSTTSSRGSAPARGRARSRHAARKSSGCRPPSWRGRTFSDPTSSSR